MNSESQLDDELLMEETMQYYIDKVKTVNDEKFKKNGLRPTMKCHTFGCQMNHTDSEKIRAMLEIMGYREAAGDDLADLVLYNTCCIRENAENKIYGNLGILKNTKICKPGMKIILCGCMMQQGSVVDKIKKSYNFVDIIFGTYNLHRLPELLWANMESGSQIIDIWQEQNGTADDLPQSRKLKFKAGVNIMYGCNNFCSYCIVPYVRGRERSRPSVRVLKEIEDLAADGVVEVMLLGQNVNSYRDERDVNFPMLLEEAAKIKGIKRIRFMTSHPKDLSDELICVMSRHKNICKHIHLPLQSGSNNVLRDMNRKYTKESYMEIVEKLRLKMPDIAITTDIITGFPTETEDDSEETLEVIKNVRFSGAFTFIYSPREGTPASSLPKLDDDAVKVRFDKLLNILNPICLESNQKHLGNTYVVLAEEISKNDNSALTGRLDDNSIVHFKGDKSLIGTFIDVKITDCKTFYLIGEIIK